jgi:hypothetical protein
MISVARTTATSQSAAAQNGGHHLVLAQCRCLSY